LTTCGTKAAVVSVAAIKPRKVIKVIANLYAKDFFNLKNNGELVCFSRDF
jgi:hypothetical protein